ncbi:MAG: TonB-dependent receptor [Gammaproteobacteria bacterium]|nr:TonB-dependent receptor [Gammaproteobacteria bacterium]MDE0285269.1 TonB-dependent receptor [Gammaproteobacteria bacterium]
MVDRLIAVSKGACIYSLIFLLFGYNAPGLTQGGILEEVIVTAQKREESIQDVGIAITAFSGEQLDAFGFTNSTELTAFTPGVHMSGNSAGHTQQFTIRGATQNDFFDLAEAPNAVYIDEGYQAAGQAQLFASFDMDRVEILKGPQGTLFGRNATGGLVHYITRKPTEEFQAYGDMVYGRYDQVRFEGAVSGALSENIKARVAGFYRRHDPILKNVFTPEDLPPTPFYLQVPFTPFGGPPRGPLNGSLSGQDDTWNDDQYAIRGQILIEPNEDVEILIKGQIAESTLNSGPYQHGPTIGEYDSQRRRVNVLLSNHRTNPNSCEALVAGTTDCLPGGEFLDLDIDNFRPAPDTDLFGYRDPDGAEGLTTSTDHAVADFDTTDIFDVTGKLTWDMDWATLVVVSHYADQEKIRSLDVDAGPAPQLLVTSDSELDWFTQEIRLEGETDRLRWIAGFYYLNIDGEFSQNLGDTIGGINVFGASPPPNGAGVSNLYLEGSLDAFLETQSYSIFGQVDYDFTEQLELNLGWRGIIEEKDYEFYSNLFINTDDRWTESLRRGGTPLASLLPDHIEDTSDFLWSGKVQLNYTPGDDLLLYAGFNRGVKAGSCNAPVLTFLIPEDYCYDEEVLLAYEIGFKSTVWDGRARVNGAAYYYDYSDYQAFQFIGTSGAVFNADAESLGFELEILANPVDNLDLMLGFAYIDPKVKDLSIAPGVLRDVEPTFTPEVQFNALGRYTWPDSILGGSLAIQVDGNYASSAFHNINNFDADRMPDYWLGNASLTWISADERWEVGGFIDNFSDTRNMNIGFSLPFVCGCDEQSYGYPRMYGARVRYNHF